MRLPLVAVLLLFTSPWLAAQNNVAMPKGWLFVVGGGKANPDLARQALSLGGGIKAKVVIIPHGSELLDPGTSSVAFWRQLGARKVVSLADLADPNSRKELSTATVVWMPGGSQNKLAAAIQKAKLTEVILARYQEGAVIGGTSTGAAVMAETMLQGGPPVLAMTTGTTQVADGLGLWPEVIIDMHFLKRQRFARLFNAVLDHPDKIGVGIDEETAVLVHEGRWQILGKSSVVVVDARQSTSHGKPGEPASATDLVVHLLGPGMTWAVKNVP